MLYEDNITCLVQIIGRYIKGHETKHISPKSISNVMSNLCAMLIFTYKTLFNVMSNLTIVIYGVKFDTNYSEILKLWHLK